MFTARRGLCCRAVSVCLSRWCIETAKVNIKLFHRPIILVFQKEIPMGSPSTRAPNIGGVPKICDFQPVFQKYRIPRYFKIPNTEQTWKKYQRKYWILIPTPNTDTDPALVQTTPTSLSHAWQFIDLDLHPLMVLVILCFCILLGCCLVVSISAVNCLERPVTIMCQVGR